jgi:type III pantothenate kinase
MYLCIDIGNTEIYGGFCDNNIFTHSFRASSKAEWSADQLGMFIKAYCREHAINPDLIEHIGISSVVPSLDYHLQNACLKYFNKTPIFVRSGIKTGINVSKFKNSHEIGADRICGAIGAVTEFPNRNILVVCMGTATTITAINKSAEFLTGIIIPGIKTQRDALAKAAAKLFSVELIKPKTLTPTSTTEAMQMGLFYSHLGGIQLLLQKLAQNAFRNEDCFVVGTGGYSSLFAESDLFDAMDKFLELKGLCKIIELNKENGNN